MCCCLACAIGGALLLGPLVLVLHGGLAFGESYFCGGSYFSGGLTFGGVLLLGGSYFLGWGLTFWGGVLLFGVGSYFSGGLTFRGGGFGEVQYQRLNTRTTSASKTSPPPPPAPFGLEGDKGSQKTPAAPNGGGRGC